MLGGRYDYDLQFIEEETDTHGSLGSCPTHVAPDSLNPASLGLLPIRLCSLILDIHVCQIEK